MTAPVVRWRGIQKVMEECAELTVELAKLSAFPSGQHPDAAKKAPLLERVENELGDVLASVAMFLTLNPALQMDRVMQRADEKQERFKTWVMSGVSEEPGAE